MPSSDQLLADLKRLHPKRIDLSLTRIERLLAVLGHPQDRLPPVIHVAGTNGKGSTVAFLKAMLEAAGRRVHVYTSPHLVHFHERIVLADAQAQSRPISETALVDVLTRVERANGGEPITFFEITTAAAFLAFTEHPADAVLLEVGLGGRLDTTNVVKRPALSVITPVSIDHVDWFGPTIELIAAEKAGILKPGVAAVIAPQWEGARGVIETVAANVGAPLIMGGQDFDAFEQAGRLVFQTGERLIDLPKPALLGRHQIVNAGVALAAALAVPELGIDERAMGLGLQSVSWPARMQSLNGGKLAAVLGPDCELWLDGGHNAAGGEALAQMMADLEERWPMPLYLVLGMMGRKDATGFLKPFAGLVRGVIAVPIPGDHETPFEPQALKALARTIGMRADDAGSVDGALDRLNAMAPGRKRVLITGSLYLAGHVLAREAGVTAQDN